MEDRRRCTSVRQLELLIEFLESHRELALGRVRSREARAVSAQLWRECAEILNAEGPARTSKEWTKVWCNFKCTVRNKLLNRNLSQRGTGGGPNNAPSLTPLEEKVASILGRDFGPLPNVQQNQFSLNNEDRMVEVEFVEEGINNMSGTQLIPDSQPIMQVCQTNEDDIEISTHTPPLQETPLPVVRSPSLSGQIPSPRRMPRQYQRRRQRVEHTSHQSAVPRQGLSSRSALDESRHMVLHIETLRAEADLKKTQSAMLIAESFKLIAESIAMFTQKYCQREAEVAEQE